MSAAAQDELLAQTTELIERRQLTTQRSRLALFAIGGAFLFFCLLCAGAIYGAFWYAGHAPETQSATLELGHGSTVEINRSGSTTFVVPGFAGCKGSSAPVPTCKETIAEGDTIRTGPDTDVLLTLFDDSTVTLNFGTTIKIQRLRSSRFFNQFKDIVILLQKGSIKVGTASPLNYGANPVEVITAATSRIQIQENSVALVTLITSDAACGGYIAAPCTQAIARSGSTHVIAQDTRDIEGQNENANMLRIGNDGQLLGPQRAEEDLISNGNFVIGSSETTVEMAPGWRLRPFTGPNHGTVKRDSETVPGQNSASWAAHFVRRPGLGDTADAAATNDQVGIEQDISRQVSIYNSLELTMTVKIAEQSPIRSPDPGQIYPLTVRLVYEDSDGNLGTWTHSFYYTLASVTPSPDTTAVGPAVWASPEKPFDLFEALDHQIAVVRSLEIDASGSTYDVWVTDIRLIGR